MKTIKFIGLGSDYANVMTEEGESIVKLRFEKDCYKQRIINGRLYLYVEGNDEPVGVFAKRFYYCFDDGRYVEGHDVVGEGIYAHGKGITGLISYTEEREVNSDRIKKNGTYWDILVEYK